MKKTIRLTETELIKLVKEIINEQGTGNDRIANIASAMRSVKTVNRPTPVIINPSSELNNVPWANFIRDFKVTAQEIQQARMLISKLGTNTSSTNSGPGPGPVSGVKPTQNIVSSTPKPTQKTGPGSVGGGDVRFTKKPGPGSVGTIK
jgi:hypothetical protein